MDTFIIFAAEKAPSLVELYQQEQSRQDLILALVIIGFPILIIGGLILAGWLVLSGLDGLNDRWR